MRRTFFFGLVAMVSLMAGIATAASAGHEHQRAAVAGDGYVVRNLVSDQAGVADFNGTFQDVTPAGGFTDAKIPQGYAPFGIQSIGGNIFVTYAQQDADKKDDVSGQGHGFVDEFDVTGKLLQRVATHGQLNS